MDYFYVADGFGANGLVDYYVKARYKPKDNLSTQIDVHRFVLPTAVTAADGTALEKGLGTEIDVMLIYNMTKAISIEGGYSRMFSTKTMTSAKVKNVKNASETSNWAYVMIAIKPEFIIKPN